MVCLLGLSLSGAYRKATINYLFIDETNLEYTVFLTKGAAFIFSCIMYKMNVNKQN